MDIKKMNKPVMLVVALLAVAMAPASAALLTYLAAIIGGLITVTPAFSAGVPFTAASVVAGGPANVSGSIINNGAAMNKPVMVNLTGASGTMYYGAASEITTMDVIVNGVSHTFLSGECIGGTSLICTTIAPMAIANGTNVIDVIPTPHMLFDPAQSPITVDVTIKVA